MALNRYQKECERLLNVMEKRLGEAKFLACDYSIADIATFPWLAQYRVRIKDYVEPMLAVRPNVTHWLNHIGEREGVKRGMTVPQA